MDRIDAARTVDDRPLSFFDTAPLDMLSWLPSAASRDRN
jgi:hypothetical protein